MMYRYKGVLDSDLTGSITEAGAVGAGIFL
jgi:hypothetical protein